MLRLLALLVAALVLPAAAQAAPPAPFPVPQTVAPDLTARIVAAAPGAVAYVDLDGGVWATRVRADGSTGSPLPAAQGQQVVRDLQVAVTDGGELVVLWATTGRIRYAVAPSGRSFAGSRTLSAVASHTAATPRMAALRGGTVAVVFRDRGALRYARRAPRAAFGPVRSLGHDGVAPEIRATPGGGALLAWGRGPLTRRALEIATARRGAALPGRGRSVAGRIRALTLTAGDDGTAWVAWTARTTGTSGFARRIRAANAGAVGPVQGLGNVAYGVPRVALAGGRALVAWNAQGPSAQSAVVLASAAGTGAALGPARPFGAGGFAQTSPAPAFRGAEELVVFTRQVPDGATMGLRNEVIAAGAATGEGVVLGASATIGTPAVAAGRLVAWPAATGGVAVVAVR
jgi:hypothetical protein